MIQPAREMILVRFEDGKAEPLALDELAARIVENEGPKVVEPWIAEQIACAIFYYLRTELKRDWISSRELFWILRAAVEGLTQARQQHPQLFDSCNEAMGKQAATSSKPPAVIVHAVVEADLHHIAVECGGGFELAFFDRLGGLVGQLERERPAIIRLTRLRPCVKTILGAHYWSRSCQRFSEEILGFVRGRLSRVGAKKTSVILIS